MNFSCHTRTAAEAIDRVRASDLDEDDKAALVRLINSLQPPPDSSVVASAHVSRQPSSVAVRFEARTSAPLA